jgi:hypothetical protein
MQDVQNVSRINPLSLASCLIQDLAFAVQDYNLKLAITISNFQLVCRVPPFPIHTRVFTLH